MDNDKEVTANDNSIKRQVPGVLTEAEKAKKPNQLSDQEYYYRVTDYRGY